MSLLYLGKVENLIFTVARSFFQIVVLFTENPNEEAPIDVPDFIAMMEEDIVTHLWRHMRHDVVSVDDSIRIGKLSGLFF